MDAEISASRGLGEWLARHDTSFACTSYETGILSLVGSHPDGAVAINGSSFDRAMGLSWQKGRLYLAARGEIWRLENMLEPSARSDQGHDLVLVPRNAQVTGDLDVHELGVTREGRIVFANTAYSCIATTSTQHSFEPLWKPPFISRLAPEDRCHLNGIAFGQDALPAYVSVVGMTDIVGGWRDCKRDGGAILDVASGEAVVTGLSMPHSPRIVGRTLYLLESGRGYLMSFNLDTGERRDIAFCPGFLRGLALHDGFALVTVSKPREQTFSGLPIEEQLTIHGATSWCGVLIIDLTSGDIVEWLRFQGAQSELFDVAVMPGVRTPAAIAPASPDSRRMVTFDSALAAHLSKPSKASSPARPSMAGVHLMTREAPAESVIQSGLEAVYLAHRATLVRFLRARGAGGRAEDLVQELWIRISSAPVGPVSNPLGYLYSAANNLMINAHRDEKRAAARNESWGDAQAMGDQAPVEERLVSRQEVARARDRLKAAGDRVQEVFFLFRVEGMSQRDIAQRYGLSVSTVEKDIQRGYRALAALKEEQDD